MVKAKKKVAPAAPATATPAFYLPGPDELEAAGFTRTNEGNWQWFQDGPDVYSRWHIHLYLHPKTGEFFIFNSKKGTSTQYGEPGPHKTSVATREQFGAKIKQYGWRHRRPAPS
jgi:hypothetical protein